MKKVIGIVLALFMAAGLAAPVAAQFEDAEMDDQWGYAKINNDGSFEALVVVKMDVGDRGTANMMLTMLESNPSILGDAMLRPKLQKNHKLDDCVMVTGRLDLDGERENGVMTMCADGSSIYMVMGTERKAVESVSKDILEDGEPTAPNGYMDISGAL